MLIKGLYNPIRQSMRRYRPMQKTTGLPYLAFYATLLLKLQGAHQNIPSSGHWEPKQIPFVANTGVHGKRDHIILHENNFHWAEIWGCAQFISYQNGVNHEHSSSSKLSSYVSEKQACTSRIDLWRFCFDKRRRTPDCSHITNQKTEEPNVP